VADPVLHLLAGPNGAGKTTFFDRVLEPVTHLHFVNADLIAEQRWPGDELAHAYDASAVAAEVRDQLLDQRRSFVTETVFSHESKVALLQRARAAWYRTVLHVVLVPEELAVARVRNRVENGGHDVPEEKVRARFARLWRLIAEAVGHVDEAHVHDNTSARRPYRDVATFHDGAVVGSPDWPPWTPTALTGLAAG
jgi:predicted ABC-type ATPase